MNMRYFSTVKKQADKSIDVSWHPGPENLGDYSSKHHPASEHVKKRPILLHTETSPRYLERHPAPHVLRGCVKAIP